MPACTDCHEPCWQCRVAGETEDLENAVPDGDDQEGSVVSSDDSFSLVDHNDLIDADIESVSSSSIHVLHDDMSDYSPFGSYKGELSCPLSTIKTPPRSYVHTPNVRLNQILTTCLALSVTAVLALGMGHFLGWSNQWWYQKAMYRSQIGKLKGLQDELILCMQRQEGHAQLGPDTKPCFEKGQDWQQRFTEILSENEEIRTVLMNQEPGRKVCSTDPQPAGALTEEMNQLRMDLLHKQLEHLSTVQQYEDIKNKERESRQRMQKLQKEVEFLNARLQEEEREDEEERAQDEQDRMTIRALEHEIAVLRTRLHEEEIEDQLKDELDRQAIEILETENKLLKERIEEEVRIKQEEDMRDLATIRTLEEDRDELRAELDRLKGNQPAQRTDDIPAQEGTLREQINTLELENTGLRQVIARLRYSPPSQNREPFLTTYENSELPGLNSPSGTDYPEAPVSALQQELQDLRRMLMEEQEDARRWRLLYEERFMEQQRGKGLISWLSQVNLSRPEEAADKIGDFPPETMGSNLVAVMNMFQKQQEVSSSALEVISVPVPQNFDSSNVALLALQGNLQTKFAELQTLIEVGLPEEMQQKLGKVIRKTMKKLQEFGRKPFPFGGYEQSLDAGSPDAAVQIETLGSKLNMKWAEVMNLAKMTGESVPVLGTSETQIIPLTVNGEFEKDSNAATRIKETVLKDKKEKLSKKATDRKYKKGGDLEKEKKLKDQKRKLDKNVDSKPTSSSEFVKGGSAEKAEREKTKKDKKPSDLKDNKKNKSKENSKIEKKAKSVNGPSDKKYSKEKENVNKMKTNKQRNSEETDVKGKSKNQSRERTEKKKKDIVSSKQFTRSKVR